jgi:tetratricopeptide (TPR) repeat protein
LLKSLLQRALRRRSSAVRKTGAADRAVLLEISGLLGQQKLALAAQKLSALAAASPDDVDVAMLGGQLALMRGERGEAVKHFERAAVLAPALGAAHAQLGALHAALGHNERAEKSYQAALAAGLASAGLHNNLGTLYLEQGKLDDAQRSLEAALRLDPALAAARNNLGRVLRERRDYAAALECFRVAAPAEFDARVNMGFVLNDLGEHLQARDALLACAQEHPHHVAMLCGLGGACIGLGQLADAERHFEAALAREPENPNASLGLANVALLRGEFARGWELYEARTRIPRFMHNYGSGQARWHGEPLPGRTLLVYTEQGYGDILLFARFLPLLARARATVVFRCRPSLARLFDGFPGVDRVIRDESAAAAAPDAEVPLLSLAHVLAIARGDVPGAMPYLRPPDALVEKWRERVAHDRHVRIGLAWGGNPNRARNGARVPAPQAYQPLNAVDGVSFYNLQVGYGPAELAQVPLALIDDSAQFTDFADTAALIANLDLVISVDTSVAHLAGAMGKPTWLLHSGAADWRWEIAGVDSPWYPSVRIFRRHGDGWQRTLAVVADALRDFATAHQH